MKMRLRNFVLWFLLLVVLAVGGAVGAA